MFKLKRRHTLLIALAAVLCVASLMTYWLIDEKPTALAEQWSARLPQPPDAENGYDLLVALGVSAELNAIEEGRRWVEAVNAAHERALRGENPNYPPVLGAPLNIDIKDWCQWPRTDCLAWSLAQRQRLVAEMRRHAVLVSRYESLMQYPAVTERVVFSIDAPLPSFQYTVHAARLYQAQRLLDFEAGNKQSAVDLTAKHVIFARRFLQTSHTLIQRMIAAAVLTHATTSLSELLRADPGLAVSHAATLSDALSAMTDAEKDMTLTLRAEFQYFVPTLRTICRQPSWMTAAVDEACGPLHHVLYREQATINLAAGVRDSEISLLSAPPAALASSQVALNNLLGSPADILAQFGYNAMGRRVAGLTTSISTYAIRLHDTDALLRAVAAQAREYRVQRGERPTPPFMDVYDGTPIEPRDGRIVVRCRSEHRTCAQKMIIIPQ